MNDTQTLAAVVIPPPRRFLGVDYRSLRHAAMLLLVALLGLRAMAELSMLQTHGADAQMGIWIGMLIVKMMLWFLGGAIAFVLLRAGGKYRWIAPLGCAAFAIWAAAIGFATWQYEEGRRALADAAEPATPPERLRELVHFDGIQAGYELDNRLAANRNTPPDALRALAGRVEQTGTQQILATNPRTPADARAGLRPAMR